MRRRPHPPKRRNPRSDPYISKPASTSVKPGRAKDLKRAQSSHPLSDATQQHAEEPKRYELEVLNGLASTCKRELSSTIRNEGRIYQTVHPDHISFEFSGSRSRLLTLRTAVAAFQLVYFKVPHPREIIRGPHLERLLATIRSIRKGARFSSFRIGAAGSDSDLFETIKRTISEETGLTNDDQYGQMSIRFRRSRIRPVGWDVLIRLTPLPLSARPWRIENMPGALNATIAAAMVLNTAPKKSDRFLNLMCGSGTILAERAAIAHSRTLIGVDISGSAVAKARINLAHLGHGCVLLQEDIAQLSLPDMSADVICSDLPWGRRIGERATLSELYANTIAQATRVCVSGGIFAALTQENQTFQRELARFRDYWSVLSSQRIKQSDYSPTLYFLRRTSQQLSTSG